MATIAIIGAGFSGLVAAGQLSEQHDVVVFEKSRGVGGRMATRYGDSFEFDHGTQFFTSRSDAFATFLEPLLEEGVIASWNARFAEARGNRVTALRQWDDDYPHYVGLPRMNAIGKRLADGLDVRLSQQVTSLSRQPSGWLLEIDGQACDRAFDWIILTAPAEQTAALVPEDSPLRKEALQARMLACYALMLGFERPLGLEWQAALVRDADISWISVNSSKPGRRGGDSLVVHSTNAWAESHLDAGVDDVREHLLAEASRVCRTDLRAACHIDIQRWRYANIDKREGRTYFIDTGQRLAACGDWFIRGRVEAAFTSGADLARSLVRQLAD